MSTRIEITNTKCGCGLFTHVAWQILMCKTTEVEKSSWLRRALEDATEEVKQWPQWMRNTMQEEQDWRADAEKQLIP